MIVSSKIQSPLSILKTEKSWKIYRSPPASRTSRKLFNSLDVPFEVQDLVQKLATVDGVARVRAIAPRAVDIHWLEFELELYPETELEDEIWDKIQDLVIDCEWDLRDKTNEKWYFYEKVVEKFIRVQNGAKVVARSRINVSSSPIYSTSSI